MPSPTLAPTPTPTVGPPDWAGLARGLGGRLARPGDAAYDSARVLYNTRFDGIRPEGVARCSTVDDVRRCVEFAARHRVPLAIRSGGHSYIGASTGTGLVIDVGPMAGISVSGETLEVGAGAKLIDVYAQLADAGRGIAAGSCPTVGITGLTLGGGLGVLTRAWGLTCDSLKSGTVVTADGQVRTCDASREPDLFWALRGGGGGFGVVTSLTFRTNAVGDLAIGFLTWPWSRAADVIRGWQSWLSGASSATWSNLVMTGRSGGAPAIRGQVLHLGPSAELNAQIDALTRSIGSAPATRFASRYGYLDAMLLEAGCLDQTVEQCHLAPAGVKERETYVGSSAVADPSFSDAAIGEIVGGLDRLRETPAAGGGAAILDGLGGAAADVAADATAFPHRSALAVAQLLGSWSAASPASTAEATTKWLRSYADSVRTTTSGGAYVNYPDAGLTDPGRAYFGVDLDRLRRVKASYDPDEVFGSPHGIRPG